MGFTTIYDDRRGYIKLNVKSAFVVQKIFAAVVGSQRCTTSALFASRVFESALASTRALALQIELAYWLAATVVLFLPDLFQQVQSFLPS